MENIIKTSNQAISDAKRITIEPVEAPFVIHVSKAQLTKLVKELVDSYVDLGTLPLNSTCKVGESGNGEYWLLQKNEFGIWEPIGDHPVFITDEYDNIYIT